ncbi:hypothetical protein AUJ68_03780 [Candidatus Woesearchaeota archaeon CG1_02_57_44]|nr:MAG: hypothetical protein AUJ68_03780 [Candidatus Woesearchaeota archaeon CG1_02_57_44]
MDNMKPGTIRNGEKRGVWNALFSRLLAIIALDVLFIKAQFELQWLFFGPIGEHATAILDILKSHQSDIAVHLSAQKSLWSYLGTVPALHPHAWAIGGWACLLLTAIYIAYCLLQGISWMIAGSHDVRYLRAFALMNIPIAMIYGLIEFTFRATNFLLTIQQPGEPVYAAPWLYAALLLLLAYVATAAYRAPEEPLQTALSRGHALRFALVAAALACINAIMLVPVLTKLAGYLLLLPAMAYGKMVLSSKPHPTEG